MSTPNGATGGANNTPGSSNTDAQTAASETANQNAGTNQSATSGAQNGEGTTDDAGATTGKITFTPAQQDYINSLIKTEKQKEIDKLKKQQADEKDLSDKQIAEKRAADLQNELSERDKRDAFRDAIDGAKVVDPKALYLLIGGELEFADGKIKNLSKTLETARVNYPYLFATSTVASVDGGKTDDKTEIEATPGVGRMSQAYGKNSKA